MYITYINYVCNSTISKIVLCIINFYLCFWKNDASNTDKNLKLKSEEYPFYYIQFTTQTRYTFIVAPARKYDRPSDDGTIPVNLDWNERNTLHALIISNRPVQNNINNRYITNAKQL